MMSFMYPMGLLGLIGIPIVIIIYILRSKYNEQTVTSTYLWKLSEKFLKRKNPFSGITGIISLLLQILTIVVISFAIAHPIFVLPQAANDYCFILDTSGSMNMNDGEETRIERAKAEISKAIKEAAGGSTYTLTCVSDEAVRIFEGIGNKDTAVELVEQIKADHVSAGSNVLLTTAQRYFDDDPSTIIYIVTDKSYEKVENVEIIDVGVDGVKNYAVFDVTYEQVGGKLTANANVIAYGGDAELEVKLFVDGSNEALATTKVFAKDGEETPVTLEGTNSKFSSFTVTVTNEDGYVADNTVITYNIKNEKTYSTLVVSDTGFFFRAALDALLDSDITVITPDEYAEHTETYGLYIFDSYTPEKLPDGAVWLINSDRSLENSGFGVRGKVALDMSSPIQKSSSTATAVRTLLEGVDGSEIYIANYVKYSGMYLNFATMFTYDSNPLIFAGTNGLGNRQVVFGFDIHESNIALTTDFVTLLGNLVDYSFPNIMDQTNFTVGDEAWVNVVPNAENIKAISPTGKEVYADSDGSISTFKLSEVGTYTVSMNISGVNATYNIYSGAHPDESVPTVKEESFSLSGEKKNEPRDGEYDPTMILFICLAVLFIADWGVYCYEKYQLR